MKNFIKNKKGVTLLEGLIALALLALVSTGTFAVLLSASRKSSGPDIREEMIYAVDKAHNLLQAYAMTNSEDFPGSIMLERNKQNTTEASNVILQEPEHNEYLLKNDFGSGLCYQARNPDLSLFDEDPFSVGEHNIPCLLPPICDRDPSQSSFTYIVRANSRYTNNALKGLTPDSRKKEIAGNSTDYAGAGVTTGTTVAKDIRFNIQCNGFVL